MADDKFKGAFYQGREKPSFLTRLGRGLMGFGEGTAGRGPEYLAGLQAQMDKEEEDLLKASVTDAREINRLLGQVQPTAPAPSNSFDDYYRVDDKFSTQPSPTNVMAETNRGYNRPGIRESVDILNDRIGLLRERGQDDSDTMRIRDRLLSGDIEAAQAELGSFLGDAQTHRPDWFPQAEYAKDNEVIELANGRRVMFDKTSGNVIEVGPADVPEPTDQWVTLTPEMATEREMVLAEDQWLLQPQINLNDGQLDFRGSRPPVASTNIYTANTPRPPAGWQYKTGEDGQPIRPLELEVITGGPVDLSQQANEEEKEIFNASRRAGARGGIFYKTSASDSLSTMIDLVENQTPANAITGKARALNPMTEVAGSALNTYRGLKDNVGADIGFERLAQMRAQSKTGGALGQVSEGELKLLMATLGSMNEDMEESVLLDKLYQIQDAYNYYLSDLRTIALQDEAAGFPEMKNMMMDLGLDDLFKETPRNSNPLGFPDAQRISEARGQ
tara:strand:- start:1920 stop:3425 length:1506 start_codon:yes stop_codon:yes gene_type:complete